MSDLSYTDEQLWEVFEDPQARIRSLERQLEAARKALEEVANNCDPEDPPWHNSEEGRCQTGNIARTALAQLK